MADNPLISQITLPSGNTYDIKDAKARADIAELQAYTDYLGVTTTTLADGGTTNPITINEQTVTAVKGNIVNYGSKEFIFNGTAWQEFGDLSGLGNLAFVDDDDLEVSVSGTAEAQTFSGSTATLSVTVNQGTVSASGDYTPAGTVSVATESTITFAGGVSTSTAAYKVLDQAGSVSAGSAASFTQGTDTFTQGVDSFTQGTDTFTATVSNEVLTLGFTQGTDSFVQGSDSFTQGSDSFTADTPTTVTLPTFQEVTVVTSATSDTSSISVPATFNFTGTAATISVTGTTSGVSADDITYTPAGTNSASSVSGTGTVSISS